MKRAGLLLGCFLYVFAGSSCAQKVSPSQVVEVHGQMIPIVASLPLNPQDTAFLGPYKRLLDSEMSEKVACAADRLEVTPQKHENKLCNFAVDMIFDMVNQQNQEQADLAMLNVGGLRAPIAQGDIRLKDIFSVFPFDNKLALVTLRGKDIKACLPAYRYKANGVSHARVQIQVQNGEPQYQLWIGGKPLEDEKLYRVATIDYLAEGNDGFVGFAKATDKKIFDLTLRDAALQYLRMKTRQGVCVDAPIDGRVVIIQNP